MSVCLITNVGQRDLQYREEPLNPRELRKECYDLQKRFHEVYDELSAPMIEASLKHILMETERVDCVLLLASDQKDKAHLPGDTIVAAEIIAKLLPPRFEGKDGKCRIQHVKIIKIKDAPSDYDVMMEFYRNEVIPNKHCKEAEKIYLLCTGGTPACNTALMLNGVNGYLERAEVLYVREKESFASATSVGAQILDHHKKNSIRSLLEQYDFNALAVNETYDPLLREMAQCAAARMNFDFQDAHFSLKKLQKDKAMLPYKETTETLARQLAKLSGKKPDTDAAMLDLYWSAHIKWHRNECADFLGRVWRLYEASMTRLAAQIVPGVKGECDWEDSKAFNAWVDSNVEIKKKLESVKDLEIRFNTRVITIAFKHYVQLQGIGEEDLRMIKKWLDVAEVFDRLKQLRNHSIIAHGFKGLSKKDILEEVKLDGGEMLNRLAAFLPSEKGENPFDVYRKCIGELAGL